MPKKFKNGKKETFSLFKNLAKTLKKLTFSIFPIFDNILKKVKILDKIDFLYFCIFFFNFDKKVQKWPKRGFCNFLKIKKNWHFWVFGSEGWVPKIIFRKIKKL